MTNRKNYAELVQQAEKAVASVKDPELRRIAFQKILESLFADSEGAEKASEGIHRGKGKAKSEIKKVAKARAGTASYIFELVEEDFFKKPKTILEVKAELENRGHHIPMTSLSGPLQKKCQERVLRRQKTKAGGNKETFAYSNW